ncbi:MAG: TonB-dependent receptor plug domain-containing protein, partial [Opitutaceae bacterium]|nr:TonB-dependent receptor plug domain-containing protein [Opitutaceae bacterium]
MCSTPHFTGSRRFVLAVAAALVCSLQAQDTKNEAVITLEKFISSGSVGEDSIVPTVRPIASVLGREGSILDTPRAVSTITRGQLEERNVQRVEDLSQFIAGAFTAPIFGNAGVPTIRGDLGEGFQNGQRKAFNRNSFPISFNGIESVDAVKGALPAFYGYSNATGGYVNFVTKRPYFDRQRTTVRAVVGEWQSYRWQVDTSGPLSEKAAYRFSYEGSDADSFYRLVYNDSQSLFAAFSYKPNSRMTWDLNGEYMRAHFTENPGITRPTQDLIDHNLYITGSSVQNGGTGSYFGNTFTPTGTVRIDGSQTLLAPGDGADAETFNVQSLLSLQLGGQSVLNNRTYFESVEAEKHSSYYFYSWMPENYTFDNRTELISSFALGETKHDTIVGMSVRGEHRKTYVDVLNEIFNAFDVTMDPSTLVYPRSQLFFVTQVPGKPYLATPGGRYPRPGRTDSTSLSATLESDTANAAFFVQDQIRINDQWSVLVAGRIDALWVDSQDPLPLPGNQPVGDSIHATLPSATMNLVHKPTPNSTLYFTLNRAAAVEGSSSSGGFGLTNNKLFPKTFKNSSDLIEVGGKVSMLENTLFAGTAVYYQRRNRINVRSNLPDEIEVQGVEVEAIFQPNRAFNAGANFTYSHANFLNGPSSGSAQTTPIFSPSTPSGNFGAFASGTYRLPAIPLWLFNVYSSYMLPSGF